MRERVAGVVPGQRLLGELIDREVDGVGRASAETHGAKATIEAEGALGAEDSVEDLAEAERRLAERRPSLHPRLEGVDGEHGGVLDEPGDGPGHHELPEVETVMLLRGAEVGGGRGGRRGREELRRVELCGGIGHGPRSNSEGKLIRAGVEAEADPEGE